MRDDWRKAAIDGDSEAIDRLLADGAPIDSVDRYGQTALMLAAVHGREKVVRRLLESGPDMDVTAKFGLSALMLAAINRHTGIAERLVDAGANGSLRDTGAPGFQDKTAQQLAQSSGQLDLAAYLARRQAAD